MNNQIVGNRADGDRLLREPKEVLPTAFGFSAVEAEGKFIQIVVKVLVTSHVGLAQRRMKCAEQRVAQEG